MFIKLIFSLIVIAALFAVIHKYKKAPPAERKSWLLKGFIAAVIIAVIVGAITGRIPVVAGLIAFVATFARFGLRFGMPLAKVWLAKNGGNATFKSSYLVMTVNVANGHMTGQVIKGEFAEQSLGNLSEKNIEQLREYFNLHDKKSYYLLTAYLRSRGFSDAFSGDTHNNEDGYHFDNAENLNNQRAGAPNTQKANGTVTRDEAMDIFGFKAPPTKKEITTAHRKLMSKLHPDKGGSHYLATRVNQAREVLLQHCQPPH